MSAIHITERCNLTHYTSSVFIEFNYDEHLVSSLKSIPKRVRAWDGAKKRWRIDQPYAATWINQQRQAGRKIIDHTRKEQAAPNSHGEILQKCAEALSEEHFKRIYRIIASALHPDAGGSTREFQILQTDYLSIKNRKGWD